MANNLEERLNALKGKQDNVGDQFGSDDIRTLVEGIEYAMSHGGKLEGIYYGQYDSVESLPKSSTLTNKGYAYVVSSDPSVYYIYKFDGEGAEWEDSGNKFVAPSLESDLETKSATKAPTTEAVKDGIEAVDITATRSGSTELSAVAKYNASANINDRTADVVVETGVVKALGYKVLNPRKRFAEQVEGVKNANTVFEIKDGFDLGVKKVAEITGSFVVGENETAVTYYYAQIEFLEEKTIAFGNGIFVADVNNAVVENEKNVAKVSSTVRLVSTVNEPIMYVELGSVTISPNCTLRFKGGNITNAIVVGSNTAIEADLTRCFSENTILDGTWNNKTIYPEWFCSNAEDYSNAMQRCIDASAYYTIGSGKQVSFGKVELQTGKTYKVSKSVMISAYRSGDIGGEFAPNTANTFGATLLSSGNFPAIIIKDNCTYFSIYNLNVGGVSKLSCPAISCGRIADVVFRNLSFYKWHVGIGFGYETTTTFLTRLLFENIRVKIDYDVDIPIYINSNSYLTNLIFRNLDFTCNFIGVYIKYSYTTGICVFEKCTFDNCGTKYDIDDYEEYGMAAIKLDATDDFLKGFVIKECYFEHDCPLRQWNSGDTYDSARETKNNKNYVHPTTIDWENTGEIVVKHGTVSIENCHFSPLMLSIASYDSNVSFKYNTFYRPGVTTFGDTQLQSYIVRIDTPANTIMARSVDIDLTNLTPAGWEKDRMQHITSTVYFVTGSGKSYLDMTLRVVCPAINEFMFYKYRGYVVNNVYVASSSKGQGQASSLPLGIIPSPLIDKSIIATYILTENANITANIGKITSDTIIKGDFTYQPTAKLEISNCTVIIDKSKLKVLVSVIMMYNAKLIIIGTSTQGGIEVTNGNYTNGAIQTHGDCTVELHNVVINKASASGNPIGTLIVAKKGKLTVVEDAVTNNTALSIYSSAIIGDTASRPELSVADAGYMYYDTTFGKPIYWKGTAWVDANGETVGLQVSDTSVLIGAAAGSSVTVNVYHANALTVSALNPDNTPATWLTVPDDIAVGTNTLTISAAENTASNPRGAKVIISDGTDAVIVNVVQNYATT